MTEVSSIVEVVSKRVPWNKGKIVGAKPPLLISGTGWMAGIGHGQTHHSSATAACPFRANSGHPPDTRHSSDRQIRCTAVDRASQPDALDIAARHAELQKGLYGGP